MATVTLITGGARSGKSQHALALARAHEGRRAFLATAEAIDDEMNERIRNHRDERGNDFITIEEPLEPARAVASLSREVKVVVIDCLTVWLGNLLHHRKNKARDYPEISRFLETLHDPPCDMILVSNEVGMGIVPQNDMARHFRDLCGWLNQRVAEQADSVILMVSGIPLSVKRSTR